MRGYHQGETESKPLTFGELPIGAFFISFPLDGDDSGHGGFRGSHRVFTKVGASTDPLVDNAVALGNGVRSHMPASMKVIRVAL